MKNNNDNSGICLQIKRYKYTALQICVRVLSLAILLSHYESYKLLIMSFYYILTWPYFFFLSDFKFTQLLSNSLLNYSTKFVYATFFFQINYLHDIKTFMLDLVLSNFHSSIVSLFNDPTISINLRI